MPTIRPSADLRNSYNEISEFCHEHSEPVFITKNGKGDLAVMSIELYDTLKSKCELYSLIEKGFQNYKSNEVVSLSEGLDDIRKEIDSNL